MLGQILVIQNKQLRFRNCYGLIKLIDLILWYDSLLNDLGKKLLTTYVLKTHLSANAKIRLRFV